MNVVSFYFYNIFLSDYLHTVIKEVSEAEERGQLHDDLGMGAIALKGASGSSDSLSGDEVITFTARKSSSKFILFSVVAILVYKI